MESRLESRRGVHVCTRALRYVRARLYPFQQHLARCRQNRTGTGRFAASIIIRFFSRLSVQRGIGRTRAREGAGRMPPR